MSISSTGLYGSATIVNSDLFTDVETLKETVTTLNTTYLQTTAEHRTDISENRDDISQNKADISKNRVDISQNKADISKNRVDISCTSGCKYWKVNFDPDDKDDTYMNLTQSSKEQFLYACEQQYIERHDDVSFGLVRCSS